MSWQATQWVLRCGPQLDDVDASGAPYGARARAYVAVLIVVAEYANANGQRSHPGLPNLIEQSRYGRSQVRRILDELERDGWLTTVSQGGGRARAAVFELPRMMAETGSQTGSETGPPTLENGSISGGNGSISDPKGVHIAADMDPQHQYQYQETNTDAAWAKFWNLYPIKADPVRAEAMFRRATATTDVEVILTGLRGVLGRWHSESYKRTPNAARWLSEQRWLEHRTTNPEHDAFLEEVS